MCWAPSTGTSRQSTPAAGERGVQLLALRVGHQPVGRAVHQQERRRVRRHVGDRAGVGAAPHPPGPRVSVVLRRREQLRRQLGRDVRRRRHPRHGRRSRRGRTSRRRRRPRSTDRRRRARPRGRRGAPVSPTSAARWPPADSPHDADPLGRDAELVGVRPQVADRRPWRRAAAPGTAPRARAGSRWSPRRARRRAARRTPGSGRSVSGRYRRSPIIQPPPWIQTTSGAGVAVSGTQRSSCSGR